MTTKLKRRLFAAGTCLCLLLAAGLPASAEYLELDVNAQMTMKQLRSDPGIIRSGITTYAHSDANSTLLRKVYENQTLEEYVGKEKIEDCVETLNMAIENGNKGIQVTWQLYSEEEIAENPALGMAQLFYFPAEQPNAKYVLTIGGNADITTGELGEAVTSAAYFHKKGYTVFALRYRTFLDAGDDASMRDALQALKFIDDHAEQFSVQREDYALLGFSSGGHIAGILASDNEKYGYRQLGVSAPAAVLLAYPVNDFFEAKPAYSVLMDPGVLEQRFYWLRISDVITPDYPPTYFWCGRSDKILALLDWNRQSPVLEKALVQKGVPHKGVYYNNAEHAVGVAHGTDAEGWMDDALAFWQAYMKN